MEYKRNLVWDIVDGLDYVHSDNSRNKLWSTYCPCFKQKYVSSLHTYDTKIDLPQLRYHCTESIVTMRQYSLQRNPHSIVSVNIENGVRTQQPSGRTLQHNISSPSYGTVQQYMHVSIISLIHYNHRSSMFINCNDMKSSERQSWQYCWTTNMYMQQYHESIYICFLSICMGEQMIPNSCTFLNDNDFILFVYATVKPTAILPSHHVTAVNDLISRRSES